MRAESVLQPFGLEHLASRATNALTARESKQVSLALAMAHADANAVILHEPLLALDDAQVSPFQRWIAEVAGRACVVCVTTSLHDARVLGGPHARLTAYGWEPLGMGARSGDVEAIALQGRHARKLASEIALTWPVQELALQLGERTDTLRVVGDTRDVTTKKLIVASRATGFAISRLWTEVIAATDVWSDWLSLPSGAPSSTTPPRSPTRALLMAARCEIRWRLRGSRASTWVLVATLPSALAIAYGMMLRASNASWARYESLVFLSTILTPLWSLWVSWLVVPRHSRHADLGGLGRYGVDQRWLALVRTVVASAIVGFSAATASLLVTSYVSSWRAAPPAAVELYQYAWIAALGGALYGAVATYLSYFKRRWLLSWAFILLDLMLGGMNRSVAYAFPRAHIHNLLGSPSSIDLSQPASCAALGIMLLLAVGLTSSKIAP